MNIEQYRAMVAEEEKGTQEIEQPEVKEETKEETTPEEVEETKPEEQFVEIDGEQIDVNELRSGYLRQSDYTKKTQKLASEKKEIEEALRFYDDVRNNPAAIESLRESVDIPRTADPTQAHLVKLEQELYDMKLENELNLMQSKYDDFEIMDVLGFASDNNMTDLEDAYILHKAKSGKSHETSNVDVKSTGAIDIESIKQELLEEIKAEFKGSKSTSSIISSKQDTNVDKVDEIRISSKEQKTANAMGLTVSEYAKWRDIDKVK